jgi:hypothetical protein
LSHSCLGLSPSSFPPFRDDIGPGPYSGGSGVLTAWNQYKISSNGAQFERKEMAEYDDGDADQAWERADAVDSWYRPDLRIVWPSGVTIKRDRLNQRGPYGWTIVNGKPEPFVGWNA